MWQTLHALRARGACLLFVDEPILVRWSASGPPLRVSPLADGAADDASANAFAFDVAIFMFPQVSGTSPRRRAACCAGVESASNRELLANTLRAVKGILGPAGELHITQRWRAI